MRQLRESLRGEGLEVISEIPFDREFIWDHGSPWKRYSVLVIWGPGHAYEAMLSDRDGGLLVPFNMIVAADDVHTLIAVGNYAFIGHDSSAGLQILTRNLALKMHTILVRLSYSTNSPQKQMYSGQVD
jgi:uncharacterized protein (DUF302 family)